MDWYKQSYKTVRGVFISSPLLVLNSKGNDAITMARRLADFNNDNENSLSSQDYKLISASTATAREEEEDRGIRFDTAIRSAYNINPIVQKYLESVDRKKVSNVLDIEKSFIVVMCIFILALRTLIEIMLVFWALIKSHRSLNLMKYYMRRVDTPYRLLNHVYTYR